MFDKIALVDNEIVFVKWQIIIFKEIGGEIHEMVQIIFDKGSLDTVVDNLVNDGVEFRIEEVDIPGKFMQYKDYTWYGSLNEAILYINGDNEAKTNHLKALLAMTDYKSIRDSARMTLGVLSERDIEKFRQNERQRQEWRDEISEFEE